MSEIPFKMSDIKEITLLISEHGGGSIIKSSSGSTYIKMNTYNPDNFSTCSFVAPMPQENRATNAICEITLNKSSEAGKISVKSDGCESYCGAGAYLDGDFTVSEKYKLEIQEDDQSGKTKIFATK